MKVWKRVAVAALLSCVTCASAIASEGVYSYDDLGRLSGVVFPDGRAITYSYDANGNRTRKAVAVVNRGPMAVNDSVSTNKNTAVSLNPRSNDSDPDGDALLITAITQGANGAVTNGGNWASLVYTPNTGFAGSDSFTYTISDGALSATATVTVTVTVSNQVPVAGNDSHLTNKNTATSFDPRANDSDPDGDALAITAKTNGANGTVVITGGGTSLTYTPNVGFTGGDSFNYTISDGALMATATVTVMVNDPPVAVNDHIIWPVPIGPSHPGFPVGRAVYPQQNDMDADGDALTITAISTPTNGAAASIQANSTGLYIAVSDITASGTSFTYTISDGKGGFATGTVTLAPYEVKDTCPLGEICDGGGGENRLGDTSIVQGSNTSGG